MHEHESHYDRMNIQPCFCGYDKITRIALKYYSITHNKVKHEQMVFIPLKLYFCCKINFHLSCPLWLFKVEGHKDLFLMSSESLLPTKR